MLKSIISAVVLTIATASASQAAAISQFNKTTNDGVFTLTEGQAAAIGFGGQNVDRIGFFRVREGSGTTFNAGDTFDVTTMNNTVTSGAGNIIAFLNGTNLDLTYTGDEFDVLGTTAVGASNSYFRGVAFLFSSLSGNITFRGSSTFNAAQTRGAFDGIAEVPLPAAAPLFLGGLAAFGLAKRRSNRAAA